MYKTEPYIFNLSDATKHSRDNCNSDQQVYSAIYNSVYVLLSIMHSNKLLNVVDSKNKVTFKKLCSPLDNVYYPRDYEGHYYG